MPGSTGGSPTSPGPEGVPVVNAPPVAPAPSGKAADGATVDGIRCQANEQVLFHVHAHLAVYVDGSPRQVPYGIGIAPPRQVQQTQAGPFVVGGTCFYWLHTHAADGVIHIESPVKRSFTLGQFFDIWRQPLSSSQVGPAHGTVTAYVGGKVFQGDPRSIPLTAHAVIQLDVGKPLVPPRPVTFPPGL